MRKSHGEIAGAGTEVGHHRIGFEREGLNHRVRFLPGIALGVIKHLGPFVGVTEAVLVAVGGLRQGGGGEKGQCEEGVVHVQPASRSMRTLPTCPSGFMPAQPSMRSRSMIRAMPVCA